ncbi:hypothetical protein [Lactococcus lactis]|uniref:Uncharacterized protein n=1 Tax=Lactococcus lactis TaxID=1358 RepID=A0AAP3Z2N2_9LACT|nr:hypothetical protein [Lactococcus lactis]MDG4969273.1 hypothetical protein [Lactococcus lactis]MDG4977204.1 hypothetical protein [Lactococcus lactis]MDG5103368.1 hypothetical protein [Lactococcus lactis]TNU78267.1 hypothetical protein FIB48_09540 [Lactococcus lactis subsp. lactis]
MKFKAKPDMFMSGQVLDNVYGTVDWLVERLDDEGYIHGYYVDGYIVGKVADATDEYFNPEFWCPIDKSTLVAIGGDDDENRL